MKKGRSGKEQIAEVVPLFGRDEMNLVEFPIGPITAGDAKTFEVEHPSFDKTLNRVVIRKLLITGSDAFGLPKPIDDEILMGMKALTYEAGFRSRKIEFSRYQLCRTLGWPTDGRTYRRLEEAFDRIAGTTLKFKDAWWVKGESEWRSKTFHLIEEVELCSRDRLDRQRLKSRGALQPLCSFVWSDVIWQSFQDGYMKKLDMAMWRKISSGRRREVPLRLFRILDKRFYHKGYVRFDVEQLCLGTLGISRDYAPSQMARIVKRAADWLIECGFLREVRLQPGRNGKPEATFLKASGKERTIATREIKPKLKGPSSVMRFFDSLPSDKQDRLLSRALEHCRVHSRAAYSGFQRNEKHAGSTFESYRELVLSEYIHSRRQQRTAVA